jgi:hypothetical protein
MSAVAAQIEGLIRGLEKDEAVELLVKAAENIVETCLPILEEMEATLIATQSQQEGAIDEGYDVSRATLVDGMMEDWDFMVTASSYQITCCH